MTAEKEGQRRWSEDELIVLAAVYTSGSFSMGDDARDECQTIAACFGRTPSAIDRQWRNMDAVVKGKTGLNIGRLVAETVLRNIANPAGNRRVALLVCKVRGWPLDDLILEGRQEASNRPVISPLARDVQARLEDCCDGVQFKVFPSGAQGFGLDSSVDLGPEGYSLSITAVIAGSKAHPRMQVKTSREAMSGALRKLVKQVAPKTFATGRIGYYGSAKIILDDHIFQVTIRALQTGDHS